MGTSIPCYVTATFGFGGNGNMSCRPHSVNPMMMMRQKIGIRLEMECILEKIVFSVSFKMKLFILVLFIFLYLLYKFGVCKYDDFQPESICIYAKYVNT